MKLFLKFQFFASFLSKKALGMKTLFKGFSVTEKGIEDVKS